MPTLTLCVELTDNGKALEGFPYVRRMAFDDSQGFLYRKQPGDYSPVPLDRLQRVEGLVLTADRIVCVRLAGQQDAGADLLADGVLILWDAALEDSPISNVTVNNAAPDPPPDVAMIAGLAAGLGWDEPGAAGAGDGGFGEAGAGA